MLCAYAIEVGGQGVLLAELARLGSVSTAIDTLYSPGVNLH
jgi:hypothetical protein